jgi:hypothetical protein
VRGKAVGRTETFTDVLAESGVQCVFEPLDGAVIIAVIVLIDLGGLKSPAFGDDGM